MRPAPLAPTKAEALRDDRSVVAWTTAALLLCLWVGVPWAASLAAALPIGVYLRGREGAVRPSLLGRWTAAVFFTGLAMTALGADRAARSIATGPWARDATLAWIDGTDAAFPPLVPLAAGAVLFVLATAATRGLAGVLLFAEMLLCAAASAAVVYGRAHNAISASAVAVSPWTLALLAGCALILATARSWRRIRADEDARRAMVIGLALIAAGLLLRAAAAPAFTRLLRRLTFP